MIALGITAILVAIAVPTMRSFIENARIRATSESLQNGLCDCPQRGRAAQRAHRVRRAGHRLGGARAWHRRPSAIGQRPRRTRWPHAHPRAGDADRITFDSFGRPIGQCRWISTPDAGGHRLDQSAFLGSYRPLRIQIQATGTARLCNPAVGTDNPARCL